MNIQNLLNQFMGAGNTSPTQIPPAPGFTGRLSKFANNIHGGLVGGAAAGSIMALLVSNKSARKFASTAATYGGAAFLGGLAYKAFKNWQHNQQSALPDKHGDVAFTTAQDNTLNFELKLIKAMISAAKADGHINDLEQQRIFNAIGQMELPLETKCIMFDLFRQPITISEICEGVTDMTQKSELYLVSCMVIDPENPTELAHLDKLAQALELPEGLMQQIRLQAQQAIAGAY